MIACSRLFGRVTAEDLLRYTPENLALAALVILGAYAVKSLSVFFPLLALYVCSGMLFGPLTALLVNTAGLLICVSIPYGLGAFAGKEWMDGLLGKYKKARQLQQLQMDNEWFFAYFLRVINLLPGDIVSMLLGSMGMRFSKYLTGSIAGLLPTMIAATFIGDTITQPESPAFWASLGATVLISLCSFILYRVYLNKKKLPPA